MIEGQRVRLLTEATYRQAPGQEPYLVLGQGRRGTIRYLVDDEPACGVLWDDASCEEINNKHIEVIPLESEKEAMQACFSRAVAGLRQQDWVKCVATEYDQDGLDVETCRWNVGEACCAIGHLLDPEKVKALIRGEGEEDGEGLAVEEKLFDPYIQDYMNKFSIRNLRSMLTDMVDAHDGSTSPIDMKNRFESVADRFGLDDFGLTISQTHPSAR